MTAAEKLLAELLQALKSGALLFTEYVTEPPVVRIPGPLSAYDNVRDCRRNCLAVASANFGVVASVSINRNHSRR